MARTLKDDEERNKRINEVGFYFTQTGASTRDIADYFTKNKYPISNYTVSQYIKIYQKRNYIYSQLINQLIYNNKHTKNDPEYVKRIIVEKCLHLKGYNEKTIAELFNLSESTVSRDLNDDSININELKDYIKSIDIEEILNELKETNQSKSK